MYQKYGKRLADISGALILFPFTAIVFIIVAGCIKLDSRGPILFRQKRTGKDGEPFTLYKFRSMPADNDVHDTSKSDSLTRVGKVIRATSLDEIPQLINIIKGDMSFIGPRPWITDYYDNMNSDQRRRNNVRPGITGRAQAYGRNSISIQQKIAHDLDYVDNVTLLNDVKIIFVTIKTLFDKESNTLGKSGIHEELQELKKQNKPRKKR